MKHLTKFLLLMTSIGLYIGAATSCAPTHYGEGESNVQKSRDIQHLDEPWRRNSFYRRIH